MSTCRHTGWLRLRDSTGRAALEVSDRPCRLLDELPDPDQPAGLAVLIGHRTKSRLLSSMCPSLKCPRSQRHHGEIHLHASHARPTKPCVVAEADLPAHARLPVTPLSYRCHEVDERPVADVAPALAAAEAADEIYRRQLFPFVDAVCLFVADIGGPDAAARRLAAWSAGGPPSTSPVRPALLLVVDRGDKSHMQDVVRRMSQPGDPFSIDSLFQPISVVALTPARRPAWQARQLMAVRRRLYQAMDVVHKHRHRTGLLFSARHTAAFLRAAADGIGRSPQPGVNLVRASRAANPVAPDLASHLANVLRVCDDAVLERSAIPAVASSLILDQYPPGMHRFHVQDVFDALYRDPCEQVAGALQAVRERAALPRLPFDMVDLLLDSMTDQFRRLQQSGTAAELHRHQLILTRQGWEVPSSEETCFVCMRRRPRYCLPCAHWMCPTCIRIFARRDDHDPWLSHLDDCLLCGALVEFCVRLGPATATPRVLSIDGGGTRGRAPLEFLRVLQDAVALPYPVQHNFDVVFGTSSGAMIACALCINGWSVDECTAYFEASSRLAFQRRPSFRVVKSVLGSVPVVMVAIEFAMSLLVDSKYSAGRLEAIQQDAYGLNRSIVDSRPASRAGALVGVTLTRTGDTGTVVATNYNPAGRRHDHPEYEIVRFDQGAAAVPLWEILRCSTAAPYYFTSHHIRGAGTFQDGGLTFNNPASIAIEEAAGLFPGAPEPSLVVSLGTGSASPSREADAPASATWGQSFLARLYRAFWKQGDAGTAWNHILSRRDSRGRGAYFRLDLCFEADPPALDDVGSMGRVAQLAREAALGASEVARLARCLRAELFVFELVAPWPRMRRGAYRCEGRIYCRLRAGTDAFETLMRQLTPDLACFQCQGRSLDSSAASAETDFCLPVAVQVPDRGAPFRITLQEGPDGPCDISGSPFTIARLTAQQRLDSAFGRDDHQWSG